MRVSYQMLLALLVLVGLLNSVLRQVARTQDSLIPSQRNTCSRQIHTIRNENLFMDIQNG